MKITADTEDKREDLGLGANFRRRHDARKALLVVKQAAETLESSTPLEARDRHQIAQELLTVHAFLESEFSDLFLGRTPGNTP